MDHCSVFGRTEQLALLNEQSLENHMKQPVVLKVTDTAGVVCSFRSYAISVPSLATSGPAGVIGLALVLVLSSQSCHVWGMRDLSRAMAAPSNTPGWNTLHCLCMSNRRGRYDDSA